MKLKLANFSQAQVHLNELPKQTTLIAVDFESGQKHVNQHGSQGMHLTSVLRGAIGQNSSKLEMKYQAFVWELEINISIHQHKSSKVMLVTSSSLLTSVSSHQLEKCDLENCDLLQDFAKHLILKCSGLELKSHFVLLLGKSDSELNKSHIFPS